MSRALVLVACLAIALAAPASFVNSFGIEYDIAALEKKSGNYIIDDRDAVQGVEHVFYFNVNSAVHLSGDLAGATAICTGSGVCQGNGKGQYWDCGDADTLTISDHPGGEMAGFTATYTGGVTPGSGATRNTVLYFTCPSEAYTNVGSGQCYMNTAEEYRWFDMACRNQGPCECDDPTPNTIYYVLEYTTEAACPIRAQGLGWPTMTLIVLACGFAAYFLIGIFVKAVGSGARGIEVIPQIDFWRELPELVRDGCIYTWAVLTRCFRKDQYVQVV